MCPPFDFMELKHSFENFFLQTNSYAKRIFWFQNSFGCKICLNLNFLEPKFVWFKFLVKQIFWTWTFFDPSLFCNHVQKLFCSKMVLVLNFFGIRSKKWHIIGVSRSHLIGTKWCAFQPVGVWTVYWQQHYKPLFWT